MKNPFQRLRATCRLSRAVQPTACAPGILLLTTVGAALAACGAAPSARLDPLELRAEPKFDYRASVAAPDAAWVAVLGDSAARHGSLTLIESAQGPEEVTPARADASTSPARIVEVQHASACLDLAEAESFLGWRGEMSWAVVVDRAELELRLERLREALPGVATEGLRLVLEGDRPVTFLEVNQQAYLRDFRFEREGAAVLGDPGIGVLGDGISLFVQAGEPTRGAVPLRIDLALAERQDPAPEADFRLPMGSTITLQQPLILAQSMRTNCSLTRDEALLLVTLGRENSSELLFTILTVRP